MVPAVLLPCPNHPRVLTTKFHTWIIAQIRPVLTQNRQTNDNCGQDSVIHTCWFHKHFQSKTLIGNANGVNAQEWQSNRPWSQYCSEIRILCISEIIRHGCNHCYRWRHKTVVVRMWQPKTSSLVEKTWWGVAEYKYLACISKQQGIAQISILSHQGRDILMIPVEYDDWWWMPSLICAMINKEKKNSKFT